MTAWLQVVLLQGGVVLLASTLARFILATGGPPLRHPSSAQDYRTPSSPLSHEALSPAALALISEGVHRTVQTVLAELAFEGQFLPTNVRERVQLVRGRNPSDPLALEVMARVSTKMAPDETVSRLDLYNHTRDVVVERRAFLIDEAARHGLCASQGRRTIMRGVLALAALVACGVGIWALLSGKTVLGLVGAVLALGVARYFWNRHGGEKLARRYVEELVSATTALRDEVRTGKRRNPRDAAMAVALEGVTIIVSRPEFAAMAPPRPTRLEGSPYNDGRMPL
jgi:uncharacterized protein (TIGR04222 family)